jgi:hypothetical protein
MKKWRKFTTKKTKKKKEKQKDWVTLPHASKNRIKRTNYKPAETDEEPCMK